MYNFRSKIFNADSKLIPIVVVPGFLTKNDEQWGACVAKLTRHPVHLLNWGSFSVSNIFFQPIKIGWPAFTIPLKLWVKALKEADNVAYSMADYISEKFSDTPFILLGHSLGGRIVSEITFIMNSVEEVKNPNLLSTIIIAGAINNFTVEINSHSSDDIPSMGYINFFSRKDQVLSKLYRAATLYSQTPVGIVNADGCRIINKETELGHSDYLNDLLFRFELARCIRAIQNIYVEELAPSRPLVMG